MIFSITLTLTALSCTERLNEKMKGLWIVEEFKRESSSQVDKITFNVDHFIDNKNISLPLLNNYNEKQLATYKITHHNNTDTLTITNRNTEFQGKYELQFAQDPSDNNIFAKLTNTKTTIIIQKIDFGNLS